MPLPQKWNKKKQPPEGFDVIEPVLEALENELRDKVRESNSKQRKMESTWPVHQINWQRTRYVYDMYYTYHRISNQVYQYCIQQKLIDAALIAKWKKPGYERLCSTYVINPNNYKFNTVSICRVPYKNRTPEQRNAKDPTTGCLGCASGSGKHAGPRNIFGNKYGQNLAAVQIAREKRMQLKEQQQMLQQQQQQQKFEQDNDSEEENDDDDYDDNNETNRVQPGQIHDQRISNTINSNSHDDDDGNEETDDDEDDDQHNDGQEDADDDDDDYGPAPSAGIWAGSKKLQQESESIAYQDGNNINANSNNDDGENETDDEVDDDDGDKGDASYQSTTRPNKKLRAEK